VSPSHRRDKGLTAGVPLWSAYGGLGASSGTPLPRVPDPSGLLSDAGAHRLRRSEGMPLARAVSVGSGGLVYLYKTYDGECLMIEHLKTFPDNVLAFVCHGHVTKADYDEVLVPAVMNALKRHDKVRLYYETAQDFGGIAPGAVWEDFKVGMEHLLRWERFAVVTDVEWIKHTMRFFSFLLPGALKVFPASETAQARKWISAKA